MSWKDKRLYNVKGSLHNWANIVDIVYTESTKYEGNCIHDFSVYAFHNMCIYVTTRLP